MDMFRGMKDLPTEEYSPEKAGGGGSIPSLATIFNNLQVDFPVWLHLVALLLHGPIRSHV